MDTRLPGQLARPMVWRVFSLRAVPAAPRASLASYRLHPSLVGAGGAAQAAPVQLACSRHLVVLTPGSFLVQGALPHTAAGGTLPTCAAKSSSTRCCR